MSLSARLGVRTRQARLKPLLLATCAYLILMTIITHGFTTPGTKDGWTNERGDTDHSLLFSSSSHSSFSSSLSSSSFSTLSSFLPSRSLLETRNEGEEEEHPKLRKQEETEHTTKEEGKEEGKEGQETKHGHHKNEHANKVQETHHPHRESGETAEKTHHRHGEPGETAEKATHAPEKSGGDEPEPMKEAAGEGVERKEECTRPAIEQFPRGFMSPGARRNGGLIIHILITAYMFLAIAIVCDTFFVPSLEMICDSLSLTEDVAGATFMAAGSSAPELATSVIAVFVAKDDIGISGVIGSAVFNIMFVVSVCALFAGHVISLNWWPLIRDSTFYCLSICALLLTIYDKDVTWYESIFLLALYGLYIFMMYHNARLEEWANTLNVPFKTATKEEKSSLFGSKPIPPVSEAGVVKEEVEGASAAGGGGGDGTVMMVEGQEESEPLLWNIGTPDGDEAPKHTQPSEVVAAAATTTKPSMAPELKDEDYNPWEMPVGVCERLYWGISLPIVALHHVTTPDCRRPRFRRWYLMTFVMSMVWIALYSYLMVWMITVIGFTLGIRDTVMGLTLVAVGVSAPDALSSLCVAKQGFGDMAVSNAIGSNVFDILLCLGLPWFLRTAIVSPGSVVPVESRGLMYSTISLFSTVIFLIVATHLNGWKLDKKYGIILMIWYLVFMVLASLYELNVFSNLNPPQCPSPY